MDTGIDTAKIAYGNRPFVLQPPPLSIVATRWIGVMLLALSAWGVLAAIYAWAVFGLSQFVFLIGVSALMAFVGTLTCAFGWKCKYAHETLQIIAYQGKRP